MVKKRQNQLQVWAIALSVSGLTAFVTLALASVPSRNLPQHAALNPSFSAFVFPNPVRRASFPTLVVAPGISEKITAHIYDPAGTLVFQTRVDDHPLISSSKSLCYEVPLEAKFQPGVYVGIVAGYHGGSVSDHSIIRFSVVK